MTPFVVPMNDPTLHDRVDLIGGKAANLYRMAGWGVQVPPLCAVTTAVHAATVAALGEPFRAALAALSTESPAAIAKSAGALRALFRPEAIPADAAREIVRCVRETVSRDGFLAVRSSATAEDSAEFSYAGQLDSFLFVKTDDQILDAVARCFASGYSDRAVAYRAMKGQPQDDVRVAVVVQRMIEGVVSGVAFTVNPVSQRVDELLISATWGLGEGLVSGQFDSDQYVFRKGGAIKQTEQQLAKKSEKIVFDAARGHGTAKVPVDPAAIDRPCLEPWLASRVAELSLRIERHAGGQPQDIEWTIDAEGELYAVQTRPITTLGTIRPSAGDEETIFDNSNIVESYSGLTSPLTFSFALKAYHMVYVQFCEVLKVPREKIIANDFAFANMLALLNGRVYYNLKNWYRLISVLPGYEYNSRFMEGMMGVKKRLEVDVRDSDKVGFARKYLVELPRLAWSGVNLAWQFVTLKRRAQEFMDLNKRVFDQYIRHDFAASSPHELVRIYLDLENRVLRQWKAPIVNDFMAMIFYGLLKTLVGKWDLGNPDSLPNELLAGQGEVESTLPLRRLQETARFLREHEDLIELFKAADEDELMARFRGPDVPGEPAHHRDLRRRIAAYLDEFGFRSMQELKLEVPSLSDNPRFVFSILKNYLGGQLPDYEEARRKEVALREAAEAAVRGKLGDSLFLFGITRQRVFDLVVDFAKRAVAFREWQRFARTKMFGLARMIFRAFGERFTELRVIDSPDDIFYLTRDEIFSFTVGTSPGPAPRDLVRLRREQYGRYEADGELPDRIVTRGAVYNNDLMLEEEIPGDGDTGDPNVLKGISACPGKVSGKVKVILNPSDDMSLNGEILVAGRTDPGWVPLYPSASGLLIERGSILSHSAIVARELGLPAIVGIAGITKRLKTGDIVEMDGAAGTVRILS